VRNLIIGGNEEYLGPYTLDVCKTTEGTVSDP